MPTQEERLDVLEFNLEQFKTETIKAYGEMAMEITMVKGLTEDAVKRLALLKEQIDHRFEHVESRFERVDTRLDGVNAHLESMDGRFERVDTRLNGMDTHLESVDGRLGRLENLLAQVLARLPKTT